MLETFNSQISDLSGLRSSLFCFFMMFSQLRLLNVVFHLKMDAKVPIANVLKLFQSGRLAVFISMLRDEYKR